MLAGNVSLAAVWIKALGVGDGQPLGEQEALSRRAAQLAKGVELRLVLDPFGDHLDAER